LRGVGCRDGKKKVDYGWHPKNKKRFSLSFIPGGNDHVKAFVFQLFGHFETKAFTTTYTRISAIFSIAVKNFELKKQLKRKKSLKAGANNNKSYTIHFW